MLQVVEEICNVSTCGRQHCILLGTCERAVMEEISEEVNRSRPTPTPTPIAWISPYALRRIAKNDGVCAKVGFKENLSLERGNPDDEPLYSHVQLLAYADSEVKRATAK